MTVGSATSATSQIEVRPVRFAFDEPVDIDSVPDDLLALALGMLGLSLTMPYLEPYLIRTMKTAGRHIRDERIAADVVAFSKQEGHHFRNHANFNERVREAFPRTASEIRAIEDRLEADYRRFSKHKPLRWNLAYAEGFEAMTCAAALASAQHRVFAMGLPGGEIWDWHMAEEIEHRTVAFEAYEHIVGSYPYRVVFGARSQAHYVGYILRFARAMARGQGRPVTHHLHDFMRTQFRLWMRTFRPAYHPSEVEVPDGVEELLVRYSASVAPHGR